VERTCESGDWEGKKQLRKQGESLKKSEEKYSQPSHSQKKEKKEANVPSFKCYKTKNSTLLTYGEKKILTGR